MRQSGSLQILTLGSSERLFTGKKKIEGTKYLQPKKCQLKKKKKRNDLRSHFSCLILKINECKHIFVLNLISVSTIPFK